MGGTPWIVRCRGSLKDSERAEASERPEAKRVRSLSGQARVARWSSGVPIRTTTRPERREVGYLVMRAFGPKTCKSVFASGLASSRRRRGLGSVPRSTVRRQAADAAGTLTFPQRTAQSRHPARGPDPEPAPLTPPNRESLAFKRRPHGLWLILEASPAGGRRGGGHGGDTPIALLASHR